MKYKFQKFCVVPRKYKIHLIILENKQAIKLKQCFCFIDYPLIPRIQIYKYILRTISHKYTF